MQVKLLKVFIDSGIVIRQVHNISHFISNHLKHYQQEVLDLKKTFDAFNISLIPKTLNYDDDILPNVSSRLIPLEGFISNTFTVELSYRP